MAVRDSIGGWKDNALNYKSPKALSTLKKFLGNSFIPILKCYGIKYTSDSIPPVRKC